MPLVLICFPIVFALAYTALLIPSATRPLMVRMTDENYPVELATFLLCLLAGVLAIAHMKRLGKLRANPLWRIFYGVFGVTMLLIGMEEISWGQWFFHFRTPQAISDINTQHEFNLHNLKGMGGHTEYLRLSFGVGGLIGVALSFAPAFQPVAAPRVLVTWFAIIAVFAAVDLYCDLQGSESNLAKAMDVMSEVIELLIALAATLYVWINARSSAENPSRLHEAPAIAQNPPAACEKGIQWNPLPSNSLTRSSR